MEKKRRARINESLQELRTLLADADVSDERACPSAAPCGVRGTGLRKRSASDGAVGLFSQFNSKMENAEVLEVTVKKVEDILKSRSQGEPGLLQPVTPFRSRRLLFCTSFHV